MGVIAKYKFNQNVYADFIPEFNSEFTDYTITDETDIDGYTIRTIESDSLPTLMIFGQAWVDGESGATDKSKSLLDVYECDTSNITDMYAMFRYCTSLTSLDVSNFNTSQVTNMQYMFRDCSSLTSLDVSNFNTSKVTHMSSMFYNCSSLTSLDVSNFNTSSVAYMDNMFNGCSSLTSLDVSNFNTENVTTMQNMFCNCSSLTSLNVSNFKTQNVTNMSDMFNGCSSLTSLDVSNFNTSQVTNMNYMFRNCSSLTSLDVSNFKTENVKIMITMFQNCSSLTSLDISNFNTENVTSMENMFNGCSSLTSLDISNFNTENVTNTNAMFYNCSKLSDIGTVYCSSSTINSLIPPLGTSMARNIYYHDANLSDLTVQDNITYQYYDKSTVTLPYELNKLPNGVADYIDVVNGVYVQRVGKQVLDSTWNWSKAFEYDTRIDFRCGLANLVNQNGANGLCDKLHYNTDNNLEKECAMLFAHANVSQWIIVINKSRLTTNDVEGFKTWLANNPTTVLYELAIPIYTPLTDEEKASLPLSAYSNGYIQLSSDELRPSKFEFRAKSSNRMQLDMLETGHYYLNAPTGNVKLGNVDIDVTEMPCLIKVDNASNNRLVVDGGTIDYNLDINSGKGYLLDSGQVTVGMGKDRVSDYIKINNKIILLQVINVSNITSWRYSIAYYDENKIAIQTALDIYLTQEKTIITSIPNNAVYCRISMQIANIIESNSNAMITISVPITLSKLPSHRIPTTFTQGMKSSVSFGYWQGSKEARATTFRTTYATGNWDIVDAANINNGTGIVLNRIETPHHQHIVEDELDISTGKHIKRVEKVVLNDSLAWEKIRTTGNTNHFSVKLSKRGKDQYNTNMLNTKFEYNGGWNEVESVWINEYSNITVNISADKCNTVEQFKEWIKENPITVYYELETPEISYLELPTNTPKTVADKTGLQSLTSNGNLYAQVKPSPLSYPTTLSPNTQYTVFHNRKNYSGSVKTPMINLGGTEVVATGSRTVVTTPSTLAHNELQFIGGENTVEQVMVLHGDWTKEGKTVDYFEGLQSSVIGDKTLENLVDKPTEIWSSNVTDVSNGGAVDYVSIDDVVAGYGNRPKLPEVQVDTNVRSYGMTLNNIIADSSTWTSAKSTFTYDGYTITVTGSRPSDTTWTNIEIRLKEVKSNTNYFVKWDSITGEINSGLVRVYDSATNAGLDNTLGLPVSVGQDYTAGNYLVFNSSSYELNNIRIRFHLNGSDTQTNTIHSLIIKGLIICEYQQGMENWNIPYFEGMRSVENPVYHSVGKNLFDASKWINGRPAPYSDSSINQIENTQNSATPIIKCKPNTTYTISRILPDNSTTYWYALYGYNKDGFKVQHIVDNQYVGEYTFTTNNDVYYLRGKTDNPYEVGKNELWQIEEGSIATSYEPYKENILSTPQGTVLRGVGSYKDMMGWNDGIIRRNCVEFTISGEEGYTWQGFNQYTNTVFVYIDLKNLGLQGKLVKGNKNNPCVCDKIQWTHDDSDTVHFRLDGNNPSNTMRFHLDKTKFSTYTSQGVNDYIKSIGGLTIVAPLINTGYEGVTFTNDYSNVDEEYQVGKPLIFNHGTLYTTTDTHPSTFLDFSLKTTNRYTVKDFDKLKYTVLTEQPFYLNGVDYPASSTGMTIIDVTGIADTSIYSDDAMITVVQDDGNYYADGVLTQFKGEKTFVKEFIRTSNDTYSTGMTLLEPLELNGLPNGVKDEYNPVTGEIIRNIGVIDVIPENLQGFENNGVTSKAYLYDTRLKDRNTAQIAALGVLSNNFSPIDNTSVYTYGVVGATNNFPVWFSLENTITTLEDFQLWFREHPQILLYQLKTPQIIQATPTSTYISTRPENGNIIAQDAQIQAEYLNYDNEQSIISPRMLGDGDEIRWEQGSQCYVYENDNEYIPLTEYNELFGANLQAQEYTQYAESVDGADIEVGVALKEKAVYEQTYVKYEDNVVYPETMENIDETNGVEVDYICGATWQNPNDLSDIRHLGELREDGQYDVTIRRSGDDEIRLLEGTTHLSLDYDKLPSSEFELTFFNSGGVEVGKYGDTTHVLEDCVENSKLASCTVYGETLTNLMTAYKEESLLCYYYVGTDPDVANVSMLKPNTLYTLIYKAKYQESGNTDSIVIRCSTSHSTGDSQVKYTTTYAEYKCKFITPDIIDGFVLGSSGHYFHVKECILLEGDWTNVNIPYFEGISSTVVNGFSSCGKNLCTNINNKNTDIIETNGAEYENKLSVTSDYIKVKKGKTYVGSNKELGESNVRLRCYDINKKYIGSTITSNTEYIRLRQLLSQETDANTVFFQLEEGSVATEFEPYKSTNYSLPTPITLCKVGDVADTYDVVSGVETRNIEVLTAQIKNLRHNDNYVGIVLGDNNGQAWFSVNDFSDGINTLGLPYVNVDLCPGTISNIIEDYGEAIGQYGGMEFKIVISKSRMNLSEYTIDSVNTWLKNNLTLYFVLHQNKKQTIQHTYIPSSIQTTQEPTFILPQPLRSVPNGICDRLYWDENKGHYCIEKRVQETILSGKDDDIFTYEYNSYAQGSNTCRFFMRNKSNDLQSGMYGRNTIKCIGSPIKGIEYINEYDGTVGIASLGENGISSTMRVPSSSLETRNTDGVKKYLKNNPQTFIYPLATPEIIDLPHLDKKVELPTQPNIYPIGYKAVHEKTNPEIGLTIPYKVLNMPTQPVNLNFVMDIADYVLTWDDVKEARQYNIILNDEVIATVKEPQFNTGEEMYGYILVEANNEIGDNLSEELYIKTVPNAPAQLTVAHNPQTDYYDFEISFIDTSDIADYYTVMYKVDGGEWVINTIQNSELTTGEKHLWSFSVYEIKESIEVWATATNDVGTNDILPTAIYYMSPTPQWTYRINSKDVFLRWLDESPYDTKYKLRYSYKSNGQYQYAYFEGDAAEIGKLYEAVLPLAEDDEVTLALCIVSEKENLYCKPVKASKPLDPNIVPPMNFNYHWLARGLIEFYWEDQYDVDVEYEYILESMKANETLWTQVNEIIPSEDVEGTGTIYRVEYQLEDLEQIRMKVRMKWAMNETEWTETLTTVFIPVEGNPPTYIRRTQTAEGLLIEWEAQAYIDSYHIYVTDNETGEELQHLETQDNSILVDLDYSNSIEIAIYEISRFSGGIESDPTDPMVFTPTMFTTDIDQRIYQPCAEKYPIEVSTVQKGNKQAYVIHDVSYTPNVETEHEIGVSIATPFTISYHPMMVDVHQAGSRSEATINAHIKTLNTRNEDLIRVMTFERTQETYDMNFTVYTPSVASYPINLEISKVRIVCLGDSLTSGHPFYWAETGTGMIEASYPYQLSRRLKNQYEVINSGYGSDTTDRCLARFDRDVLRYQPQYCIFQCGTND